MGVAAGLEEAQSFLIVRLGAIGDVLRVCPAVRRLRKERPDARIGWAVEDWVHPVLASNPNVDRFHILDRGKLRAGGVSALHEFRRFVREVRVEGYEVALDVHGRFKSGLVTRCSGARWRLGYPRSQSTEGNHWFTNRRVLLDDPLENRVLRFLELLEPLGIGAHFDADDTGLPLDATERSRAGSWYAESGSPQVAVYPGSSTHQSDYHRWPAEKWVKALRSLDASGIRAVAFWGPAEEELTRGIVDAVGGGCRLAPPTTLPEMMAMLGRFRLFWGTNTAALHMAWLQGVPAVWFCGVAEPRTDGPLAPVKSIGLKHTDALRTGVSKRHQADVVAGVTVDEALAAVNALLEESCTEPSTLSSTS